MADCFDERHSKYAELKALLTEEEYAAARESTLTAFYTPPVVIRSIYQALTNMGFQTGNLLEPSCGIGNFIGMRPEALADSKIYGVELDGISAASPSNSINNRLSLSRGLKNRPPGQLF